jgi:aminocarboxymuconate-semialdehyde decarboxylase
MIVDIHAHYVPWRLVNTLQAKGRSFPSVEVLAQDKQVRLAFAGKPAATRPITPKLGDAGARAEWMRGQGIDRQIVGGWLDMFGYEMPAQEGVDWSRLLNEHLRRAEEDGAPFTPLATVPLQDGGLAAKVLEEALDAGFAGAMIGTQPKGEGGVLDDPALEPFWSLAAERGAVVYIHPMYVCGDDRLGDYDLVNAVGRVTDTTVAVARLLFAGHVEKYAGARIVLSHGGAALPFALGRLKRNHALAPDKLADPETGFRKLYFDTVLFDPAALRLLAGQVGTERLMLGSDQPFPIGDPKPLEVVRGARFDEREEAAAEVFRLRHGEGCGCGA